MFVDGDFLVHTFPAKPEPLSVIAKIAVRGDTLELRDLAVYCGPGEERVQIGVKALLRMIRKVEGLAALGGFREVVVTAKRLTGANPGHVVNIRRRLR